MLKRYLFYLNSIGSILGSITIGVLSVIFITFFMLKDGEYFEKLFILLFPSKMKKRIEKSISEIKSLLSRYFLGLLFQITILFTIYTIVLLIFGVKDAVVIAFFMCFIKLNTLHRSIDRNCTNELSYYDKLSWRGF